jgi:hypothetical protein
VAAIFAEHGVHEVITIDPHTTTMLRSVFPKFVDGYDVKVRSYLEVPAETSQHGQPTDRPAKGEVVVDDSCVCARYEDVVEAPGNCSPPLVSNCVNRCSHARRRGAAAARLSPCTRTRPLLWRPSGSSNCEPSRSTA